MLSVQTEYDSVYITFYVLEEMKRSECQHALTVLVVLLHGSQSLLASDMCQNYTAL